MRRVEIGETVQRTIGVNSESGNDLANVVARLVSVESGYAELSIRDFSGLTPNGASGTNSTDAINAGILAASQLAASRGLRKVRLGGFGQATYMVKDLIAKPNVHLDLGEARLIRREDDAASMIRTQNPGTAGDSYAAFGGSFKITGGTFDPNGFTSGGGNILQLWFVDGLELEGVTVLLNGGDAHTAISVGGRNGKVHHCNVLGGDEIFEGGIWVVHGQFWTVEGNYVEAGDDAYIVENDPGSIQLTSDPDPLRYITLKGNTGKAERGHLLRILVDASQGAVSSPDWEITDVTVEGLAGTSGRLANGGIRIEDESATATRLVKRIDVSGLELAAGSTSHDDAAIAYGVFVDNASDVSVSGHVEVTQKSPGVTNGFGLARVVDSDDVTLDLNCDALKRLGHDIEDSSRVKLRGRVRCTAATTLNPVLLHDAVDTEVDVTLLDVPDGRNGISEKSGSLTTSATISGKVAHVAGATTGRPISFAPGTFSRVVVSEAFDFDSPQLPELAADRFAPSPRVKLSPVRLYDDFLGDVLADEWGGLVGSHGSAVPPTILVETGGVVRLKAGEDAAATMAANGCQLHSALNWRAGKGGLVFETNVALSGGAVTAVCVFVGLTDQASALEMPFTLGASDALTSNATDAVGFLYDTAADTDNWHAVGVANDVDATKQNLAVAPTLNTYERFRVEINTGGTAAFFRNGAKIGSAMSGAVRATVDLTPVVAVFARAAADRSAKVDLIRCEQYR